VPLDSTVMISYYSLIVPEAVSCTVSEIIAFDMSNVAIFGYPSCVLPQTIRIPWNDLRRDFAQRSAMARAQNGI